MALNWTTPIPNDSAYWIALAHGLSSRRINVFTEGTPSILAQREIGIQAAPSMPFIHDAIFNVIYNALFASVDSGAWKNSDGSTLTWRAIVEAFPAIVKIPIRASQMPTTAAAVAWMKAVHDTILLLRYREGTVATVGNGWGGFGNISGGWATGETLLEAIELAYSWEWITATTTLTRRLIITSNPPGYDYYGFAGYDRAGIIRATAPCPWAIPATMKLDVLAPQTVLPHNTFDAWGSSFTEGTNTYTSPDSIRQDFTTNSAAPDAPSTSGTLAWQGDEAIGFTINGKPLYDYGEALEWTHRGIPA